MYNVKRLLCLTVLLIVINHVYDTRGACTLHLNKDFATTTPVFLRNGVFLEPNTNNGSIYMGKDQVIVVACPGKKIVIANVTTSYDVLEAKCVSGSKFIIDQKQVPLKNISCSAQPWYIAQETREKCNGHNKIYKVGYKVGNEFHSLYDACFDKSLLHTHFVKHELSSTSIYMQTGLRRPSFIEGNLYGKVRMSGLYKAKNQKTRLDAILGNNAGEKYITNKQFLTRGHLAARADYSTGAETRATFHYVNAVPQWMRGNAGDWAALEEAVRRRVHELNINVTVYTGAHGVMTLPDLRGQMQDIYLTTDENNNGIVPVPMYNYKLVYDPTKKTAAAFISINSSFYNNTMIDQLQFCPDICDDNSDYNWLRWRSNDGTFSFCCDYHSFVKEIDYLPALDVRGQFY